MTATTNLEAAQGPVSDLTGLLGSRVTIKKAVLPHEKPRYHGRSGIVIKLNKCSNPEKDTGLWYVKLDATASSPETTDCFWGHQLAEA